MSELRCAVIGVGHLGQYHAQKYARLEGCKLVAVVDSDEKRSHTIAERCDTQALTDYSELLGKVNAVSIATPTGTHFQVASDCLKAGVHVLVEKPITPTIAEADALITLAKKNNCLLQVGHVEQFNPAFCHLRKNVVLPMFIEAVRLMAPSNRNTDVNVILDLMIHDLSNIFSLVKSPVESLLAKGVPVLNSETDIANVRIHFANGCIANVTASRISMKQERKLRIFESHKYHHVDMKDHYYTEAFQSKEEGALPFETKTWRYPDADSLHDEIAHFVSCIQEHKTPRVDGEAGREALKVALEISELIDKDQWQITPQEHT